MNKKYLISVSFTLILLLLLTVLAYAQTEADQLALRLSRDFGYSSGRGDIQGNFSLRASGPENLVRVVFFMDDQIMGEITVPPFRLRFITDDYPPGLHRMSAVGYTADGLELTSNEIRAEFVTAEQSRQQTVGFVLPLLGFLAIAFLISLVIPIVVSRGKTTSLSSGAPRNYRPFGGAICPKCQRPFGMHLYGLNLIVGKYDRCPYCGKWSLVRSAGPSQLAAAEAAELEAIIQPGEESAVSEAEKLKRDLDDSRYRDI